MTRSPIFAAGITSSAAPPMAETGNSGLRQSWKQSVSTPSIFFRHPWNPNRDTSCAVQELGQPEKCSISMSFVARTGFFSGCSAK